MSQTEQPLEIFCCYSHKDRTLLNELRAHLSPLERSLSVKLWYDGEIVPGKQWAQQISLHMDKAKIVLLLISAYFIQSDYCYSIEMRRALERYQAGITEVIPIILRPVVWESVYIGNVKLGDLQALPKEGKPISSRKSRDNAWKEVVEGIEKVINRLPDKAFQEKKAEKRFPISILSKNDNDENIQSDDALQTFTVGRRKVNIVILARGYYRPRDIKSFYERKDHLPPDLEEIREAYARNIEEQKARGVMKLPYDSPMYKLCGFDLGHRNIIESEEVPELRLMFGPTSYFSQIVTDLNVGNSVRDKYLVNAAPITEHPIPEFSTILGVNMNAITSDNYLVITERSSQAKVAGGKLHTSVGENLLRPKDSGESYAPDPFRALARGAGEELGIVLNKDEVVFRSFTVIPDFCQYSLIATKRIPHTHQRMEEIWNSVIPSDKWESRRLLYCPHYPDSVARFVVSTWNRWFHVALAAVVLSLLDVGYSWEEVDAAFLKAWAELSS